MDLSGNVIVSGFTAAPDVPIPAACFESASGFPAANPNFIVSINPSGEIADGGYLPFAPGGVGSNVSVKMDSIGNIYTADFEAEAIVDYKEADPRQWRTWTGTSAMRSQPWHFTQVPGRTGRGSRTFSGMEWKPTATSLQLNESGKVSNVLSNTQVFFNGIPAPLTYVQSKQINAVVPGELPDAKRLRFASRMLEYSPTASSRRSPRFLPGSCVCLLDPLQR